MCLRRCCCCLFSVSREQLARLERKRELAQMSFYERARLAPAKPGEDASDGGIDLLRDARTMSQIYDDYGLNPASKGLGILLPDEQHWLPIPRIFDDTPFFEVLKDFSDAFYAEPAHDFFKKHIHDTAPLPGWPKIKRVSLSSRSQADYFMRAHHVNWRLFYLPKWRGAILRSLGGDRQEQRRLLTLHPRLRRRPERPIKIAGLTSAADTAAANRCVIS